MSPEALVLALFWSNSAQSIIALAIGFAFSGALTNGYQLVTEKPASFRLLEQGTQFLNRNYSSTTTTHCIGQHPRERK